MRVFWKGPFIDLLFFRKNEFYLKDKKKENSNNKSEAFNLRSRRSVILPIFEKKAFKIYNGNSYIWVNVKFHHVGHKFGDFVLSKKKCTFRSKKTKKK